MYIYIYIYIFQPGTKSKRERYCLRGRSRSRDVMDRLDAFVAHSERDWVITVSTYTN